jgi:hypothetical protein
MDQDLEQDQDLEGQQMTVRANGQFEDGQS